MWWVGLHRMTHLVHVLNPSVQNKFPEQKFFYDSVDYEFWEKKETNFLYLLPSSGQIINNKLIICLSLLMSKEIMIKLAQNLSFSAY